MVNHIREGRCGSENSKIAIISKGNTPAQTQQMVSKDRDILLNILCFMGINVLHNSKQCISCISNRKSVFILWLLLTIVWTIILHLKSGGIDNHNFLTSLPLVMSPTLMIILWIILQTKRSNIAFLMKKLPPKPPSFNYLHILLILTICIVYPGILSILYVRLMIVETYDPFFTMNFSPQELGIPATAALTTLSMYIYTYFTVSFPCLATYVQSVLWWRCRRELATIRRRFLQNQDGLNLLVLLKRYRATLHTVGATEEALSTFSFFNLTLHLLNIFSGLSILLLTEQSGPLKMSEILASLIIISLSLITGMTIAAEVPIAARSVTECLRDLNEEMVLGGQEMPFMETLLKREPFAFTACGFCYLTRSLILATAGGLLTYSVLIFQFKAG